MTQQTVRVRFILANGETKEVDGFLGSTILEVAHQYGLDLEGACGGSKACSTCHVMVASEWFNDLPPADADEEDMLDYAFGLTQTSRLGCQILLTAELDGITVTIPSETRHLVTKQPVPR